MAQTDEAQGSAQPGTEGKHCRPDLDALREELRGLLDQAKPLMEHLQNAAHDARAASVVARRDLETHVRERPLTSLLIAAGLGFLLASLRRR